MSDFITVAKKSEIENGAMKEYRVAGRVITVANVDGVYMAFDGICTHQQCSLAGGFLDGLTVTCYCHGAQFDIQKGDVLAPPAPKPLRIYEVAVEGNDIKIQL